ARRIWPTLATGVASTCIAYLTFLVSGVDGLQQLAVFTISSLAAAAISTRCLLPALMDPVPARDAASSHALAKLWPRISKLPPPADTGSVSSGGGSGSCRDRAARRAYSMSSHTR